MWHIKKGLTHLSDELFEQQIYWCWLWHISRHEQECVSVLSHLSLFKLSGWMISTLLTLAQGKALAPSIELRKSVLYEDNLTARKRHGYIQVTLIKGKHYFSSIVRIGLIAHFFFNGTENLKCNPIYQFSKSIWNIKYSFFSCVPSHTEKQNI